MVIDPNSNYSCYAPNRDALIDCIYRFCALNGIDTENENASFLGLMCVNCGKKYFFDREWDIPYDNVDCDCGGHIIHYSNPVI